jgi:hypothetical protein
MATVSLKVIVDHAHLDDPGTVQRRITALGVHIEVFHPEIGVLFGSGDESILPEIRRVEGVAEAECEATYTHPPMSGDIPQ